MPRPVYRLATDTTSRRLASSRWFLARSPSRTIQRRSRLICPRLGSPLPLAWAPLVRAPLPLIWSRRSRAYNPASIRLASATSSSALSRATLPILFRYARTESAESVSSASLRACRSAADSCSSQSNSADELPAAPGSGASCWASPFTNVTLIYSTRPGPSPVTAARQGTDGRGALAAGKQAVQERVTSGYRFRPRTLTLSDSAFNQERRKPER